MKINNTSYSESLRSDYKKVKTSIETTHTCVGNGITLDEYIVADMLEHGIASAYDKHRQKEVSAIRIWYYASTCGPLCGGGGRTFYFLNGTEFLQVQDWIS